MPVTVIGRPTYEQLLAENARLRAELAERDSVIAAVKAEVLEPGHATKDELREALGRHG